MIKKINIALAVVFAVLFGLKLLLDFAESAKKGRRSSVAALALPSEVSTLAPRVYFMRWEPFFAPNAVTKHDGFCLDIIREIFPNVIYDSSRDTVRIETVKAILKSDPHAVIADFGDMKELEEFPTAEEQMISMVLCVYTLRTSTWAYTGPESLDQLRLGWTGDFNDSPVLRAFAEKWKDTPGKAVICDAQCDSNDHFGKMIEKGELDGFIGTYGYILNSSEQDDAKAFVRYRSSKPIDRVKLKFRASNIDLEWSKKVCKAFDDGVHRLYHSGFIRRLFEYYRNDLRTRSMKDFVVPIDNYSEER